MNKSKDNKNRIKIKIFSGTATNHENHLGVPHASGLHEVQEPRTSNLREVHLCEVLVRPRGPGNAAKYQFFFSNYLT